MRLLPCALALAAVFAAAATSVWAELTVRSLSPNPAPVASSVEFTIHFSGVEPKHLGERAVALLPPTETHHAVASLPVELHVATLFVFKARWAAACSHQIRSVSLFSEPRQVLRHQQLVLALHKMSLMQSVHSHGNLYQSHWSHILHPLFPAIALSSTVSSVH